MAKNRFLFVQVQFLCQENIEVKALVSHTKERNPILRRIIVPGSIDSTIEMNRKIWNRQKVFIYIEKTRFDSVFALDPDSSRKRKRTIHPGIIDTASVRLCIQKN